jgi:hypothetical protein
MACTPNPLPWGGGGVEYVSTTSPSIGTSTIALIRSVETPTKSLCLAYSTRRHQLKTLWTLTRVIIIRRCTTLLHVAVDYYVQATTAVVRKESMIRVFSSNLCLSEH